MLLSNILPTLVGALSLSSVVTAAHSSDRLPSRRAPHRQDGSYEVAQKRAFGFSAPHYSLYVYDGLSESNWPGADKIAPFNRVLLAFWLTSGSHGASAVWEGLSDSQRQSILSSYHNAGIAVMVSAFGDGDHVITDKKDPVQVAQNLAGFVKQNSLDGVDIDFEDFAALQNDQDNALDWLTKFHTELRNQLPADSYAISSTPTAWVYGSEFGGANGVYCKLQSAVGSSISWYNMQFYNGDPGTWDTCAHTMWKSDNPAFLSLKEISDQCNIPMSQITVGKLWDTSELAKDVPAQIPAPADFGACLAQAKSQISYPETGVMIWYGSMSNWDGAISYLSGTLSAMDSAPVSNIASVDASASSPPASGSPSAASASASPSSSGTSPSGTSPSGTSPSGSPSGAPQSSSPNAAAGAGTGSESVSNPAAGASNSGSGSGSPAVPSSGGSSQSGTTAGNASPANASAAPGSGASIITPSGFVAAAIAAAASTLLL